MEAWPPEISSEMEKINIGLITYCPKNEDTTEKIIANQKKMWKVINLFSLRTCCF